MSLQFLENNSHLPHKPILIPGYKALELEDGTISVQRWDRSLLLRGAATNIALQIIKLMDGEKTLRQIANATGLGYQTVIQVIDQLYSYKLIEDSERLLPAAHPYLGSADLLREFRQEEHCHTVHQHLQTQTVFVVGTEKLVNMICVQLHQTGLNRLLPRSLEQLETELQNERIKPNLCILASLGPDYRQAKAMNKLAISFKFPWIAGWIKWRWLRITHIMVPGETACFACLLAQQRSHCTTDIVDMTQERYLPQSYKSHFASSLSMPSLDHVLTGFLSIRAVDFLCGWSPPCAAPALSVFNTIGLVSQEHSVLREPDCQACGETRPHHALQIGPDATCARS